MIAGIVLFLLVVVRVIWGILGSKYSRFTSFSLHPRELALYFKGLLSGDKRQWAGHNPASSWAAIAMLVFALGLGVTGYLMSTGRGGEDLEEVYELLANGFLVVVILHVAGLSIHALLHRDAMWKSMFSGQKRDLAEKSMPVRSHKAIGLLLLLGTVWCSTYLVQSFDSTTRDLTVLGSRYHLGEAEDEEGESGEDSD